LNRTRSTRGRHHGESRKVLVHQKVQRTGRSSQTSFQKKRQILGKSRGCWGKKLERRGGKHYFLHENGGPPKIRGRSPWVTMYETIGGLVDANQKKERNPWGKIPKRKTVKSPMALQQKRLFRKISGAKRRKRPGVLGWGKLRNRWRMSRPGNLLRSGLRPKANGDRGIASKGRSARNRLNTWPLSDLGLYEKGL